jgi:hypothetical protein
MTLMPVHRAFIGWSRHPRDFGTYYVLPAHQEGLLKILFPRPSSGPASHPMNYHFTTTKAHMELTGKDIGETRR